MKILLRPMDLKLQDVPDIVLACFVLHIFCEERNIEPILADMNSFIIMERVNALTKDILYIYNAKDGEPLEMQSHDILRSICCRIMEKRT